VAERADLMPATGQAAEVAYGSFGMAFPPVHGAGLVA